MIISCDLMFLVNIHCGKIFLVNIHCGKNIHCKKNIYNKMNKQVNIKVENNIYTTESLLLIPSPFFNTLFYNNKYLEYNQDIIDLDITTKDWVSLIGFLNFIFRKTYVNYVNNPYNIDSDSRESLHLYFDVDDVDDDTNDNTNDNTNDISDIEDNTNDISDIEETVEDYIVKLRWEEYYDLKNTLKKYLFDKLVLLLEYYELQKLIQNANDKDYQELIEGINIVRRQNLEEFPSRVNYEAFQQLLKISRQNNYFDNDIYRNSMIRANRLQTLKMRTQKTRTDKI